MKFLSIVMLYAHYDDHYEVDLIESLALWLAGWRANCGYIFWLWGEGAFGAVYVRTRTKAEGGGRSQ